MNKIIACEHSGFSECKRMNRCSGYFWKMPMVDDYPCFKEKKVVPTPATPTIRNVVRK